MAPILNQPIMEHIVGHLRRHGFDEIVTTLYYLSEEIFGYFGDGSEFGVNMTYSVETSPLGTAGSVKKAEKSLLDETFIIVSGDALTDCDLSKALEFHRAKGSLATLILYRVPSPLDFGVVITDDDGRIVRFLEKPGWSQVFSDTVNTGMYILEPEIFEMMEPDRPYDWSSDIFPRLLEMGKPMFGYVMDGYWADIGSLTQYRSAQQDMLSGQVDLPIQGTEIKPGVFVGPNCNIDPSAQINAPVLIGRNCKIKAGAQIGPNTVLGDNSFVEEGALIERSIVWDSAYIGPHVGIHAATVCSRATIKRDTVLNEDVVIGDRCLVDVGCTIRPRIKIWPDKVVERGSTVTMSLIWGSNWRGSLFRDLGVAGLSNIEITPDFACRLGSAFGSCMPAGARIVTSRDSTRSSRMIKRAIISSLLSVGCNVYDMRSSALPIARHFINHSGAHGAINVRKLPGNSRVTLIELLDGQGGYLSRSVERKVESAFYREDFKRTDPDDLGQIDFISRAVEEYQAAFFRTLPGKPGRRLRVVVDYGHSALGPIYPAMLDKIGIDAISLNAFSDAKLAPRTEDEIDREVAELASIVQKLDYDLGALFTDEGERLTVVSNRGERLHGNTLLAVLGGLLASAHASTSIALPLIAPSRLEDWLTKKGATTVRAKADVRSLMARALEGDISMAGDERGGFIFPVMHPGFDAAYAFAVLVTLLQSTGLSLSEVSAEVPAFRLSYSSVHVPWEVKGAVMRHLAENRQDGTQIELIEGIKIVIDDAWVLVLPDSLEPIFHIYAESTSDIDSQLLVEDYAQRLKDFAFKAGADVSRETFIETP